MCTRGALTVIDDRERHPCGCQTTPNRSPSSKRHSRSRPAGVYCFPTAHDDRLPALSSSTSPRPGIRKKRIPGSVQLLQGHHLMCCRGILEELLTGIGAATWASTQGKRSARESEACAVKTMNASAPSQTTRDTKT